MAFDIGKLVQAEALQTIGFAAFFAGQAAVVGETVSGALPASTAGFGALLILAGSVMKLFGMNK